MRIFQDKAIALSNGRHLTVAAFLFARRKGDPAVTMQPLEEPEDSEETARRLPNIALTHTTPAYLSPPLGFAEGVGYYCLSY
jgi:hypothetical protein